ncbi:hypothetical protein JKF63_00467 [Porcisia hertigi]|uniref:Uncharacterized protein n=1 Tax=Porcisia hertigi TaxID=2761500 RepID=A0A836GYC6_9TRYP|nr:hypothetical protein JKF63_00467 [Porcisia hertigi]
MQRPSLLPQFAVMTASSLRPARVKSTTATAAAAESTTVSAESSLLPGTDATTPHPLLSELFSKPLPASYSALEQPSRAVTVADAVGMLGGWDAVERLLAQLNDAACSADASDGDAFTNALETCVQSALGVSIRSMRVVDRVATTVPEYEGAGSDTTDTLTAKVTIPLVLPDFKAAATAPSSERQRGGEVVTSTATSAEIHGYSPCLVLLVQRFRGVLALHIINIRFDDTRANSYGIFPKSPTLCKEDQQGEGNGGEQQSPKRHTERPQGLQLPCQNMQVSKAVAEAVSGSRPSPQGTRGITSSTGVGKAASTSVASAEATSSSPDASVDATSRQATFASAKDGQKHSKQKPRGNERSKTIAAAHRRATTRNPGAIPFDPLRPEETTPFNSQFRPITYNIAIPFQASI